jgi:flavodoxin
MASKSLIAFYSRKGNNYGAGGSIVNLPVGNTEVIAGKIRALTGADLFRIDTVKPYPEDYMETTEVAKEEKRSNARPALNAKLENIGDYDVIYLGYPNWWGTMPMAVWTFLESYDFAGKTIVPYCTNEGSGLGGSEGDIKRLCPKSKVLPGLALTGHTVGGADKEVAAWLKRSGK